MFCILLRSVVLMNFYLTKLYKHRRVQIFNAVIGNYTYCFPLQYDQFYLF